ncbi:MAG: biopolymer transporter ExbD [Phycisphaerales bacterium]|nr:biopolymer transporter ExbD [Phycisphaerales bacterium]
MIISTHRAESDVHLDFVPMVDVLFNLLIFFLLATSIHQTEREMRIALPQAAAAGPISAALREIVVNVDEAGRASTGGRAIGDEELAALIRSAVERNPEQKVNIRGDRATAYANVARVLDVCKAAGVAEPFLETLPAQ